MTTPSVAFLWHMHQPYYRNIITGESAQPWVRLHGIHSYYDMLRLYEEHPESGVNINFVPSLLKQLREYVEGGHEDKFWGISKIDAKELAPDQKIFILRNFFMANTDRMIKPHPRYWKLYNQRGIDLSSIDLEDAIRYFSWKDYLDMQVYYNLVWFGFKAREEYPEIDKMLSLSSSGSNFTEKDKEYVLGVQSEVLKKLFDKIKAAPKNVELTTTPFFHPIFPLLLDTNIAKRCMPNATLPTRVQAPRHAQFQLQHGLTYFEQIIGHRPNGMWPAEGSVCPEMIPFFAKEGIKWLATDEGILERSGIKGDRSDWLYQPYTAEHEGSSVDMVFRDRGLSDLISFTYQRMDATAAVDNFVSNIQKIAQGTKIQNPLIVVLLDGENPWESYENGGKNFLSGLLERLKKEDVKTPTISGYLAENPPKNKITKLFSGSWINSNYAIWVGKKQKNQAWGYIKRTMDELQTRLIRALDNPERPQKELLALESFGAACGSDWFWWFDDDFESEFKSDFDKIFRMHLKNTFSLFEKDVPVFLYEPIHHYPEKDYKQDGLLKPTSFIHPVIDGLNTSFFEWSNSVRINVGKHRGPMGQTEELFETIHFGFNKDTFYLRFDPLKKDVTFSLHDEEEVVLYLHNDKRYKARLHFNGKKYQFDFIEGTEENYSPGPSNVNWAIKNVFELGLPYAELGYKPGDEVTLIVTVVKHGVEVRHYSHMVFIVPDDAYEQQMWSV